MIVAHSDAQDLATAISCLNLFGSLGSSICLGIVAATVQHVLPQQLRLRMGTQSIADIDGNDIDEDRVKEIVRRVMESLDNIDELNEKMQAIVRAGYEVAVRWSLIVCLCFAGLALVSSLMIKEKVGRGTRS